MRKNQFSEKFKQDLLCLGARPGGILLVHSSLSSLGYVPGGAITVIDSLKKAIGDSGTLLMPALSYETINAQNPVFDLKHTPSCIGLIAETYRQQPTSLRSMHPTHSVCANGPAATELITDHVKDSTPCGENSPFHKLRFLNGQILMLGCGLNPNTSMHAIEEIVVPPYLFGQKVTYQLLNDHQNAFHKIYTNHNFSGWRQRYDRISEVLVEPDLRVGTIVGAQSYLIEAKSMWQAALAALEKDPLYFIDKI